MIEQERFAARIGISAVPTIVIGQVGVQGAQPYDVFRQVYEEAQRRAESADNGGARRVGEEVVRGITVRGRAGRGVRSAGACGGHLA